MVRIVSTPREWGDVGGFGNGEMREPPPTAPKGKRAGKPYGRLPPKPPRVEEPQPVPPVTPIEGESLNGEVDL